jgi:DNA processing protein
MTAHVPPPPEPTGPPAFSTVTVPLELPGLPGASPSRLPRFGAVSEPAWLSDERLVRAAWSRLVEPADKAAYAMVARLGPVAALRRVLAGDGPPGWRTRLPGLDPTEDLATATARGGRVVIPSDDEWPGGLNDLGVHRPFCLWARGPMDLAGITHRSVAIVGARAATAYGERVSRDLADGCTRLGITVVSGAAFGIDGAAHRGALGADGATIAVLPCGIDRVYPSGHTDLIERIGEVGAVVTEIAPGCPPTRWRFVERNRLIAALTRATVVVEAARRSGSLSTAARADRLNRPVAAVPGPVTAPTSYGANQLLRNGAVCVTSADEVAELVGAIGEFVAEQLPLPAAPHDGLDEVDRRVLDALPVRSHAEVPSLAKVAGLDRQTITAALGRLELIGLALRNDGGWRRRPS